MTLGQPGGPTVASCRRVVRDDNLERVVVAPAARTRDIVAIAEATPPFGTYLLPAWATPGTETR